MVIGFGIASSPHRGVNCAFCHASKIAAAADKLSAREAVSLRLNKSFRYSALFARGLR
jgi:hypothetical protein